MDQPRSFRRSLVLSIALSTFLIAVAPPAHGDVAPNGRIAFASRDDGDYDVYTMEADGSNVVNLTTAFDGDLGWDDLDPAWSPDGTQIAFTSTRDAAGNNIWVMDADGANPVQLTTDTTGGGNFGASWSPDGTQIAFTSTRDGDWEIYTMSAADGSNQTNITGPNQSLEYDDMNPDWSPDGTHIVYEGVRDGAWEILVANPDGTGEVNLTAEDDPPYANINGYPTWRPDGTKVLFMRQPNDGSNDWDIWVMNPDGTDKVDLLPDTFQDVFPNWSPDGTQITFSGNRSEFGTDIFVMDYVPPVPRRVAAAVAQPVITQLTSNGTSTTPDWGAAAGPPPGPEVFPSSVTIEAGSISAGTVASLNADDDNYLVVRRPKAGTTATWYGTFTGIDNGASSLVAAYKGKSSATCTQVISIFRWTDSSWVQIDSRSLGTAEVLAADLSPSGVPADFVSGTSGSGDVRVRVSCSAGSAFSLSADLLKLTVGSRATTTLFPTALTIEAGSRSTGTVTSLNADDDNYLVVRSSKGTTRNASWYGTFTGVDNGAPAFAAAYKGKSSATCTQVISIFRWTDSTWVQLDSRPVGTTESLVANLSPPGAPADFVSGTSGTGDVRVRVSCTASVAFSVSADLLQLVA